jgi:hypothetical protein
VLSFIVPYGGSAAAQQEPVSSGALWWFEMPARQRILDQPSYPELGARLGGEEHPYGHLVTDALGCSVMRRQRARRLMVQTTAESDRRGRAHCTLVAAGVHPYPSLMRIDQSHLTHVSWGVPVEIATVHSYGSVAQRRARRPPM